MLVNHLVLNLKTFRRGACTSDIFPDAQFAENKFLGPIGAPLDGISPHESWSEQCEDGHTLEEGHSDSLPTCPSDMVRYAIYYPSRT